MLYLRLIILSVRDDVRVDSETLLITDFMNFNIKPAQSLLLVTDFVNLKIKPTQSFKDAYMGRMYVRVFIGVNTHMCMNIYICTVFMKKIACTSITACFARTPLFHPFTLNRVTHPPILIYEIGLIA
jgi:hypothetical protein